LGLAVGLTYGAAMMALGIRDVEGFTAWMARSSGGVTTRGVTRMIFGLARSFLFMGDDGVLFKRFLLKDPYNPVSLADLFRLSLWKFLFFYLVLAAMALNLLTGGTRCRRIFGLAVAGSVPVLAFGSFWQGGDMERYFPLYPLFFLALAGSLAPECGWRVTRAAPILLVALLALVNTVAHGPKAIDQDHQNLVQRVDWLQGDTSKDWLLVVRDRLLLLPRDFPLDPRAAGLRIGEIVTPGHPSVPRWREEFAVFVLDMWQQGSTIWLSKRLFESRPRADSTWVEGDDDRLTWSDVLSFFQQLQTGDEAGGEDGFVRLPPTDRNRKLLSALAGSRR
jgi:hypothetical protein